MEHERTANALLLFYEKVRPKAAPSDEDGDDDHDHKMEDAEREGGQTGQGTGEAPEASGAGGGDGNASVGGEGSGDGGGGNTATPPATVKTDGNGKRILNSPGQSQANMSPLTESELEGGGGEEKVAAGGGVSGSGGVGGGGAVVPMPDGVAAYAEEVWEANVQFMLNSYVFDTEFHHFLR